MRAHQRHRKKGGERERERDRPVWTFPLCFFRASLLLNLFPQLSALQMNLASPLQASLCCSKLPKLERKRHVNAEAVHKSIIWRVYTPYICIRVIITWIQSWSCCGRWSTGGLWSRPMDPAIQNNGGHWGGPANRQSGLKCVTKMTKSREATWQNPDGWMGTYWRCRACLMGNFLPQFLHWKSFSSVGGLWCRLWRWAARISSLGKLLSHSKQGWSSFFMMSSAEMRRTQLIHPCLLGIINQGNRAPLYPFQQYDCHLCCFHRRLWGPPPPLPPLRPPPCRCPGSLSGVQCPSQCHPQPGKKCSLHPGRRQSSSNHRAHGQKDGEQQRISGAAKNTVRTIYGNEHSIPAETGRCWTRNTPSVYPDWGQRSKSQILKNVGVNFLFLKGRANEINVSFSFSYGILNVHK